MIKLPNIITDSSFSLFIAHYLAEFLRDRRLSLDIIINHFIVSVVFFDVRCIYVICLCFQMLFWAHVGCNG